MLRPGMFLQERYEILEKIGSGGMSDVYKAKCHKLNRLVAIKVLKDEFSYDSNFVSKFKMEAQAAARLSHPNIVNVYDVVDEQNIHYIVMELIEGITLKNYIVKKGRLDAKEAIGIALQVAQGIAAAHEQYIIHRDIKPQNMIISRDGKVKVADFGIAKAVSTQTIGATAMGSVHYISPEQARGGYSDVRSDIYSLGITMYEMVTGRVPFEGDNTVTIALAHLEKPITPPRVWNPSIPLGLEQIILKCTEKSPEKRYFSADSVIDDLRRALLTPDENIVQNAPELNSSAPTVTISGPELNIIRDSRRNMGETTNTRQAERRNPAPAKNNPPQRGKKKQSDDEVNPKIEKLLTSIGVVVAVIIVAVLIVIFAQIGGIFNFTSKKGGEEPTTVEMTETTAALKDTEVYMPDVQNLTQASAEDKLKQSSLYMKVSYEKSDDISKGNVISQEVKAGTIVDKHSTINIVVSEGSDKIDLTTMNLESLDLQAAKNLLEYKGLLVSSEEEFSERVEKGKVIRYSPTDKVAPGGTVTLYISMGPKVELVKVPSIVNRTEEEAIGDLEDVGLLPGEVTLEHHDTIPQGNILNQGLEADSEVAVGSTVDYVVSSGPEKKTQYIARIDDNYSLKSIYGPGSNTSTLDISIVVKQIVNGQEITQTLMEPRTFNGDASIPLHYDIIGEHGVLTGELQILDLTNGTILKTYPLTFVEGN